MKLLIILSFLFASKKHLCNWEDCQHIGKTFFTPTWKYKKGSTGYKCEKMHFYNPAFSYEKCEKLAKSKTGNLNY